MPPASYYQPPVIEQPTTVEIPPASASDAFPYFTTFPSEIQLKIWCMASDEAVHLTIKYIDPAQDRIDRAVKEQHDGNYLEYFNSCPPNAASRKLQVTPCNGISISRVNSVARQEYLRLRPNKFCGLPWENGGKLRLMLADLIEYEKMMMFLCKRLSPLGMVGSVEIPFTVFQGISIDLHPLLAFKNLTEICFNVPPQSEGIWHLVWKNFKHAIEDTWVIQETEADDRVFILKGVNPDIQAGPQGLRGRRWRAERRRLRGQQTGGDGNEERRSDSSEGSGLLNV